MLPIRHVPEQFPRMETGPLQHGSDWPGVFIRGDDCFHFAMVLKQFLEKQESSIDKQTLLQLELLLRSSTI